jgi:hypothetical protein
VGIDVLPDGNTVARSKCDAFDKLVQPTLFTDLRLIIGMFSFYQNFLPNYELCITPWRVLLKNEPNPPHSIPKEQEASLMTELWTECPIHPGVKARSPQRSCLSPTKFQDSILFENRLLQRWNGCGTYAT